MKVILTITLILGLCGSAFAQSARSGKSKRTTASKTTKLVATQPTKPTAVKDAPKVVTGTASGAGMVVEEVKFKGEDVTLAGTLFLPKNKVGQKVPALLMIADFYSTRDGITVNKGVQQTYRELAEHFVTRGFAVLRYDRRCLGASDCPPQLTMSLASVDGLEAVKYLRGRKEIDPAKVWVFGHGDGSFFAASVASNKEVAGLIVTAAPGRAATKLLRDWERQRLLDAKASEAEIAAYMSKLDKVILALSGGGHKPEDIGSEMLDEYLAPLVKHTDYAFSWLVDDPLPLYPAALGPVLVIHGAKDRRIPVKDSSYILESMKLYEHKEFETHVLPEMDYFLKANKSAPSLEADNDLSRPLDQALLKLLDEWLAKKVK